MRRLNDFECNMVYSLYMKRIPMAKIARILATRLPGITSVNVSLTSAQHCKLIREQYLPLAGDLYAFRCRLVHNDTTIHRTRLVKETLDSLNIHSLKRPPESSDINPLEQVSLDLMSFLRDEFKPNYEIDMAKGIRKFWNDSINDNQCRNYIGRIRTLLRKVVSTNGSCVMDM
ncbi:hypothetical protein COOONC_21824 [Cooperia oncophora]